MQQVSRHYFIRTMMSECGVRQALKVARENIAKSHQQYCQVCQYKAYF